MTLEAELEINKKINNQMVTLPYNAQERNRVFW
ncbi:MAG: hypothetical protein RLY40_410 [Pseudomonadota bacterium]|jgi:hypothetical protein